MRARGYGAEPRVVIAGSYRDGLGLPDQDLRRALGDELDARTLRVSGALLSVWRDARQLTRAVASHEAEVVHLLDARAAPAALLVRRRFGTPISLSLSALDVTASSPSARLRMAAIARADHAFVSDRGLVRRLHELAPELAVTVIEHPAQALPWPPRRRLDAVARALRGLRPGRLVVGVPWSERTGDLRWFLESVRPQLTARPACLVFGAPRSRGRARMAGLRHHRDVRVIRGRIDADLIAAVARSVDAFAVSSAEPGAGQGGLQAALIMGGVPVVTRAGGLHRGVVHEQNAFVLDSGDHAGFTATLSGVLAMPAVQRHFLGEEFARYTLGLAHWESVAETYAERFSALAGRPPIPSNLRAA